MRLSKKYSKPQNQDSKSVKSPKNKPSKENSDRTYVKLSKLSVQKPILKKPHPFVITANRVLKTEISALNQLFECFNESYIAAIQAIIDCKGKIIVSGIGKSGHIAAKIAATFASTGTSAFFIHPSEASHGDLGNIRKNDVVIMISNSGQTKELQDLIHYCSRLKITSIAITSNLESQLARSCSVSLILPAFEEANLLNAPTTSTTLTLALGDCIAVSVLEAKAFDTKQFGNFHPGGKLGLDFIKVSQLMRVGKQIPVVSEKTRMDGVLIEMTSKHLGCVAVIDKNKKLVGIITDGDLRRHVSSNFLSKNASQIMTKNPITTNKNSIAREAVSLMNDKGITSIFIVENQEIQGVLHIHDCLRAGLN